MKTVIKRIFGGVLSVCGLLFTATAFAGVLDPNNPYLEPTDDGNAMEVNVIGTEEGQQDSLVNVIKGGVNRVLAILALIALIILLYGGFLMVTSAGDEDKYNKGYTILKHAAIGLIMIGVAWFIISIVFRLVNITTSNAGPAGTDA